MSALDDIPVPSTTDQRVDGRRDTALPRSAPEVQGVSSDGLLAFVDDVEAAGLTLHSLMVVRHGVVVAEGWWAPYAPAVRHSLWSLSKSVTATAVGLAQAEGLLSVDDLVLDHLGDHGPAEPSAHLRAMRVRHLLTMTTGHHADPSEGVFDQDDWVTAFLALPVEHEPGTHFVYNTAATYVLAVILHRRTGQRLLDYVTPRLLEPLGIVGATWEQSPQGVDAGGFGLAMRTEDVARFGQLYLDDGVWQGRRLLPEGWAAEATRSHGPSTNENPDWQQGYGYQFWRGRHGSVRGDGAFGQFCVLLPELDAVVVTTAGDMDMQGILDRVWTHLLPAFGPDPLPEDPHAYGVLLGRLAGLSIDPPTGMATSPGLAGWAGRAAVLERPVLGVVSVCLEPGETEDRLTLTGEHGGLTVEAGHSRWVHQTVTLPGAHWHTPPHLPERVALSARWARPDVYEVTVLRYETAVRQTVTLTFDDAGLTARSTASVSFGDTEELVVRATFDGAATG